MAHAHVQAHAYPTYAKPIQRQWLSAVHHIPSPFVSINFSLYGTFPESYLFAYDRVVKKHSHDVTGRETGNDRPKGTQKDIFAMVQTELGHTTSRDPRQAAHHRHPGLFPRSAFAPPTLSVSDRRSRDDMGRSGPPSDTRNQRADGNERATSGSPGKWEWQW